MKKLFYKTVLMLTSLMIFLGFFTSVSAAVETPDAREAYNKITSTMKIPANRTVTIKAHAQGDPTSRATTIFNVKKKFIYDRSYLSSDKELTLSTPKADYAKSNKSKCWRKLKSTYNSQIKSEFNDFRLETEDDTYGAYEALENGDEDIMLEYPGLLKYTLKGLVFSGAYEATGLASYSRTSFKLRKVTNKAKLTYYDYHEDVIVKGSVIINYSYSASNERPSIKKICK